MASSARIDELRKKFDENPRRYFAPLANEYRKAGDIDQAIAICREYLPQQPGHMSGHIVFGQALYEARQFEEAKTVFETALTLDPENLIALRHLGDISLMLSDNEGARSWYRRVLEADPRNEEIQAQLASLDQAASSAVTPAVGAPSAEPTPVSAPAAPAKPTPSSAATVVVSAVPRPTPAAPAAPPAQPVTAVSPTAEIVLEDLVPAAPKAQVPATLEIDTTSLAEPQPPAAAPEDPGLEIESSSLAPAGPDLGAAPVAAPLEGLEATSASAESPPLDSFSLEGLETTSMAGEAPSASAPTPPQAPPPAEPTAVPPAPALAELDLDIPAAPATATSPAAPLAPLEFAAPAPLAAPPVDTGALDLDLGSLGAPAPAPAPPVPEPAAAEIAPLDFDIPATPSVTAPPPAVESIPEPVMEPVAAPVEEPIPEPVGEAGSPFVTETMAELYLQQGHREEALKVYRQLAEQRPEDMRLRDRVASLSGAPAPSSATGAESMRQLLRRIALRRPGHRVEAPPEPGQNGGATVPAVPPEVPAPAAAPASHAAAAAPMTDALASAFGFATPTAGDEHAALALAAAFSSNGAAAVTGQPARAAGSELSLDSVFGGGQAAPTAPDRNFSFDQFFSARASAEHPIPGDAGGAPASESAHDVAQFNQWLEGLKGR